MTKPCCFSSRRASRLAQSIMALGCAGLLAACSTSTPQAELKQGKSKEYFSEKSYGVKASPRVTTKQSNLRRGGGRYQVGKAYKVKGKWYQPKEDPDYVKVGAASWYGDAFHGRLTANGEVYDMTHLTAAHPTMPLPSYARVTNVNNGNSVIVRVNDRGPFAHDRVIDLSKRAAQMLDYTQAGTAKVKVEYVGRAPLEGQDDEYLLASYRPGGSEQPDPSVGLPSGVMLAMNGATPTGQPETMTDAFEVQPGVLPAAAEGNLLPAVGPLVPDRPESRQAAVDAGDKSPALLAYANQRVQSTAQAFETVMNSDMTEQDIVRWWSRKNGNAQPGTAAGEYLHVGSWNSFAEAENQARLLSKLGKTTIEAATDDRGGTHYTLSLYPDGRVSPDQALQATWAAGAQDAFIIHD